MAIPFPREGVPKFDSFGGPSPLPRSNIPDCWSTGSTPEGSQSIKTGAEGRCPAPVEPHHQGASGGRQQSSRGAPSRRQTGGPVSLSARSPTRSPHRFLPAFPVAAAAGAAAAGAACPEVPRAVKPPRLPRAPLQERGGRSAAPPVGRTQSGADGRGTRERPPPGPVSRRGESGRLPAGLFAPVLSR